MEGEVSALILEQLDCVGFLDTNFSVLSFLRRTRGPFIFVFRRKQLTSGFMVSRYGISDCRHW